VSPIAVILLLAVVSLSAFALRDAVALGSGLYRVGVSGDAPPIEDSRFAVLKVDPSQGKALLDQHVIDVLVDGITVGVRTWYNFTNVQDDHTIGATFAQTIFTITTSAGTGGRITPSGAIIVGKGLHSQGKAILPDVVEKKITRLKRKKWLLGFEWEKKDKRKSGSLIVYLLPQK
jgi:hypothetical protein